MAGKSYKTVTHKAKALDCIDGFYSDIEGLAEEAREVVDNAPDALANSPRIETFSETADTLENCQRPDDPEVLDDPAFTKEVEYQQYAPRARTQAVSRAVRVENACMQGRAGLDTLREWLDAYNEARNKQGHEEEDSIGEEWTTYLDEVEAHIEEAEAVEFPGMFG